MYTVFDIETTGLTAHDEITAIGIATADEIAIHFQTGGRESRQLGLTPDGNSNHVCPPSHDTIEHIFPDGAVSLIEYPSESALLRGLNGDNSAYNRVTGAAIADSNLLFGDQSTNDSVYTLTGFNSSSYDIPHLRTRSTIQDIPFSFRDQLSLDLAKAFQYKFRTDEVDCSGLNKRPLKEFAEHIDAPIESGMLKSELVEAVDATTYDRDTLIRFADEHDYDLPTTTRKSLEDLHALFKEDHTSLIDFDPFEDSEEATVAFDKGRLDDVVQHNAVDLKMTIDLLGIAQEMIPASELKTREL